MIQIQVEVFTKKKRDKNIISMTIVDLVAGNATKEEAIISEVLIKLFTKAVDEAKKDYLAKKKNEVKNG
jgi:hypothetical protein